MGIPGRSTRGGSALRGAALCAGLLLGVAGAAGADEYRPEAGCGGGIAPPSEAPETGLAVVAGATLLGVGWGSARRRPPSARFLRLVEARAHRRTPRP